MDIDDYFADRPGGWDLTDTLSLRPAHARRRSPRLRGVLQCLNRLTTCRSQLRAGNDNNGNDDEIMKEKHSMMTLTLCEI
eukprot:1014791-Amphidinium_carterae.1